MAHTKGPWAISRKFEVGPRSTEDDQSNGMIIPVADVFGENRDADARLIAAAPDLLDALQHLSDVYEHVWVKMSDGEMAIVRGAWEVANAAIAKAEGRS